MLISRKIGLRWEEGGTRHTLGQESIFVLVCLDFFLFGFYFLVNLWLILFIFGPVQVNFRFIFRFIISSFLVHFGYISRTFEVSLGLFCPFWSSLVHFEFLLGFFLGPFQSNLGSFFCSSNSIWIKICVFFGVIFGQLMVHFCPFQDHFGSILDHFQFHNEFIFNHFQVSFESFLGPFQFILGLFGGILRLIWVHFWSTLVHFESLLDFCRPIWFILGIF